MKSDEKSPAMFANSKKPTFWWKTTIERPVWRWIKTGLTRQEVSGSLGDLGTLLPILIGLVKAIDLNLGMALLMGGLFNVITGLTFSIPMAVQPMKAIGALAIAGSLDMNQFLTAGFLTGAIVLLMGLTNTINLLNDWIPRCVVRGIQLGVGLSLALKGVALVLNTNSWWGWDCKTVGVLLALFILVAERWKQLPAAVIVFLAGIVLTLAKDSSIFDSFSFGMRDWDFVLFDFSVGDWIHGFLDGTTAQLPLTTLNSVIAVTQLAKDLFPEEDHKRAPGKAVAISVGLMNVLATPFAAMPMCHGAGGLAGQHRFGARSNIAILFLGASKMLLALVGGGSLYYLFRNFNNAALGVMLAMSGVQLALSVRFIAGESTDLQRDWLCCIGTTVVLLGSKSSLYGALTGLTVYVIHRYLLSPPPSLPSDKQEEEGLGASCAC